MSFKTVLAFLFTAFLFVTQAQAESVIVNDVTKLNPVVVREIVDPKTVEEVQALVRGHHGPISIGGGRYSMGGQIATDDTLFINMREMNDVVSFSKEKKEITVQAGITWQEIQNHIDPEDLSVQIMQSYRNFSVGGSLSVNVHGRYIGYGPLISSVKSIKIVLPDGEVMTASPDNNAEIFYGAIGGYGGIGVIVEATLALADNVNIELETQRMPVAAYRDYFSKDVRDNRKVIFHNGDIYAPDYNTVNIVNWLETDKPLTVTDRMQPVRNSYPVQKLVYFWITAMPGGHWIRQNVLDPFVYKKGKVVKRNYEASYDVRELEPSSRLLSTYVLEEYFVPVEKFDEFVPKMRTIFQKHDANIVNVSIRHALKDPGSLMAWAREEVFAFVVYYKQGTGPDDRAKVGQWTRELIDAVIEVGGAYYLPYQPHATQAQFRKAYPDYERFFSLKKHLDPENRFRNKLWDKYYHPDDAEQKVWEEKDSVKDYARAEEQTFLTLPEWFIVFSADEYAKSLEKQAPSKFPYFKNIGQFWSAYGTVSRKAKAEYPYNFRYNLMNWVIGASFTVEMFFAGIYENTFGILTELISGRKELTDDMKVEKFIHQVSAEYAASMNETPWYEYPFFGKLKEFWSVKDGENTSFIRRWERRLSFTVGMTFKGIYAALLGSGTEAVYEPVDLNTAAMAVKDGKLQILNIPRYIAFTREIPGLVREGVLFKDIAGNKKILVTAIAPDEWKNGDTGTLLAEWPVLTEAGTKRVALVVPVLQLSDVILSFEKENIKLEHIFDY